MSFVGSRLSPWGRNLVMMQSVGLGRTGHFLVCLLFAVPFLAVSLTPSDVGAEEQVVSRQFNAIQWDRANKTNIITWLNPLLYGDEVAAEGAPAPFVVIGVYAINPLNNRAYALTLDPVLARTGDGVGLHEVQPRDVPVPVIDLQRAAHRALEQEIEPVGFPMQWAVFHADGVDACSEGDLLVERAGVTYHFDTPLDGC